MIHTGKKNVLGVMINVIDYDSISDVIINAARSRKPLSLTALAVHGLMRGVFDKELLYRLNCLDIVVPDGQPVRWALNWLYGAGLRDRVYGPNLTLAVCMRAEKEGLPIFFYGSTSKILSQLKRNLLRRFPNLIIAGMDSSKFRILSCEEKTQVVDNICKSGASIVFVGLGCPRQEVWAYEFRDCLSVPVLAVGAAFPFLAGVIPQAPRWMQDRGLEWLFRLSTEPRRLWSRYLLLNPIYLFLLMLQVLRICRFRGGGRPPTQDMLFG
jgi:N-acetylglucosaminyldiphosphoundecaprenol N-acetyl-beta-D-mannosaminyltransferase